jgi:hypothetical protein
MEKRTPHYALADVKADHRVWQDVYRPRVAGTDLYVKFTVDAQGALFLISFKEA